MVKPRVFSLCMFYWQSLDYKILSTSSLLECKPLRELRPQPTSHCFHVIWRVPRMNQACDRSQDQTKEIMRHQLWPGMRRSLGSHPLADVGPNMGANKQAQDMAMTSPLGPTSARG